MIIYGGCNVLFSLFKIEGSVILFAGAVGTKKACAIDNDNAVTIPIFVNSKYVQVKDNYLIFYDENLKLTAAFTNVPPV